MSSPGRTTPEEEMTTTTFWGYLCGRLHEFWLMFSLGLLFLILTTIVLLIIPPGTASYYVSIQVFVLGLLLVAGPGAVIWKCNR